jgi:Fe2+ or Zn2+ uptake regulation protein
MRFDNGNHFQKEHLRHILRQKGLKYTRQREAVWSALRSLGARHPSCEEIFRQSREFSPRISLATVYRTLKWLRESGIIVERDFGNGRLRYEPSGKSTVHGHLVCAQCGKVIELKDKAIEHFWKKMTQKYTFEVLRERVEGFGLCVECEQKLKKCSINSYKRRPLTNADPSRSIG